MSTPKVGLFCTFLKMGSKILKISRFQNAVKIALINEIHWNLRQMEALGLNFRNFFEFWIFVYFFMFYSYLNIAQIWIFGNYQKHRKSMVFERLSSKIPLIFSKFFLLEFFSELFPGKWSWQIVPICNSSKVTAPNVKSIFGFSGFWLKPYINP